MPTPRQQMIRSTTRLAASVVASLELDDLEILAVSVTCDAVALNLWQMPSTDQLAALAARFGAAAPEYVPEPFVDDRGTHVHHRWHLAMPTGHDGRRETVVVDHVQWAVDLADPPPADLEDRLVAALEEQLREPCQRCEARDYDGLLDSRGECDDCRQGRIDDARREWAGDRL